MRKVVFSKFFQNFFLLSDKFKRDTVFYYIYKSNHWRDYKRPLENESVSGLGSDYEITKKLISELDFFINKNNIKSILDIACGDFNWAKHLLENNKNLEYLGLDIVNDIIKSNKKLYSSKKVNFICSDVLIEDIPQNYDLIILRDFFIHIKNNDIDIMINKIKSSRCKYFAINNFPNLEKNTDVKGYGHHRFVNIEIEPYKLNNAFYIIDDYDRKLNIYKNL